MTAQQQQSPLPRLIVGAIGVLIAVAFFLINGVHFGLTVRDALNSNTWVPAEATVARINSKTHWLTYEYTVDGNIYYGTRLTITDDSKSDLGVDRRGDYPEGQKLTIYHDPNDPSRSAILPEADFTPLLLLMGFVVVVIIGLFLMARLFGRYLGWVRDILTGKQWQQE